MKTFKKTVEEQKLVIEYGDNAQSPREWEGNLGYFITVDKKSYSPTETKHLKALLKLLEK